MKGLWHHVITYDNCWSIQRNMIWDYGNENEGNLEGREHLWNLNLGSARQSLTTFIIVLALQELGSQTRNEETSIRLMVYLFIHSLSSFLSFTFLLSEFLIFFLSFFYHLFLSLKSVHDMVLWDNYWGTNCNTSRNAVTGMW